MVWNEPGSDSSKDQEKNKDKFNKNADYDRDPYSRNAYNKSKNSPPDLMELLNKLFKQILTIFGTKRTNFDRGQLSPDKSNNVFLVLAILGVIIYIFSGFYIVRPAQEAVITRFGKYQRTVGSGPHWLLNFIEKKQIEDSQQVYSSKHSAQMLTRDENIVFIEIEVQYRISNVRNYLFNVVDPINTLKQAVESAMRQVVGHAKLDFIMTDGRTKISLDIQSQVASILEQYDLGIEVVTVAFKEAKAPEAVKGAFDDVIKAREEQERLRHAAEAFANKIVPEAKGEAERMLVEAETYKQEVIAKAIGDTLRFNAIASEYNKSPEITKKRIYIDTLEEVLTNSNKILIDLKSNNLMYLPLDKLANNKIVANPKEN